jgi:hypothetical protein
VDCPTLLSDFSSSQQIHRYSSCQGDGRLLDKVRMFLKEMQHHHHLQHHWWWLLLQLSLQ